jgi:SAM-dependent methyltransferase
VLIPLSLKSKRKVNQNLNSEYWNNRYLKNDFSWDLGEISAPLKTYFDQLKNKDLRILIPGAGNSYEAEYLFNGGFTNVYVCDIAREPLNNFKKRCPAFKSGNLLLVDFFKLNNIQFDLIVEQTFFCALNPTLRQRYFDHMNKLLAEGGRLVGLLFNDALNTDKPPFGGTKEEYHEYFKSLFKIHTFETCHNSVKPRAGRELFINLEKGNH